MIGYQTRCTLKKKKRVKLMGEDCGKKRNIVAIIQARSGSTRLPKKVLMDISGRPMLWHIIERVKKSKMIDSIVVVTTSKPEDTVIVQLAQKCNVRALAWGENDVLDKYYQAAKKFSADIIVRITTDCPLIDPKIIDLVVRKHLNSTADYTRVSLKTFPRGLDTEVFSFKALEKSHREAKENYQREHVTTHICEHPEIFQLQYIEAEGRLSRPELRLPVDTKEDLELIREIYRYLYKPGGIFYTEEVIDLFDRHSELTKINAHIKQKPLKEK